MQPSDHRPPLWFCLAYMLGVAVLAAGIALAAHLFRGQA